MNKNKNVVRKTSARMCRKKICYVNIRTQSDFVSMPQQNESLSSCLLHVAVVRIAYIFYILSVKPILLFFFRIVIST